MAAYRGPAHTRFARNRAVRLARSFRSSVSSMAEAPLGSNGAAALPQDSHPAPHRHDRRSSKASIRGSGRRRPHFTRPGMGVGQPAVIGHRRQALDGSLPQAQCSALASPSVRAGRVCGRRCAGASRWSSARGRDAARSLGWWRRGGDVGHAPLGGRERARPAPDAGRGRRRRAAARLVHARTGQWRGRHVRRHARHGGWCAQRGARRRRVDGPRARSGSVRARAARGWLRSAFWPPRGARSLGPEARRARAFWRRDRAPAACPTRPPGPRRPQSRRRLRYSGRPARVPPSAVVAMAARRVGGDAPRCDPTWRRDLRSRSRRRLSKP